MAFRAVEEKEEEEGEEEEEEEEEEGEEEAEDVVDLIGDIIEENKDFVCADGISSLKQASKVNL